MICRALLIDDEQHVLAALRRELLRKPDIGHDGLEIETFTSARDALTRAAEPDGVFDLVIADYRMPEMGGINFLAQFREKQPDAVRVLLTGSGDVDSAIAAINHAAVDTLIFKPWDEYALKAQLALALRHRALVRVVRAAATGPHDGPYHLMIVDDDKSILQALEREINIGGVATSGRHPLFTIHCHTSAEEALAALADACPDVVIADFAMPGIDGITFLRHLREICPAAVRIMLSGRADLGALSDAINIAGVFHFLRKPWTSAELRTTLAQALAHHDRLVGDRRDVTSPQSEQP
jgi:DNA-binding NtrC family response regulator